jgi:hypothetical protein
MAEEQAQPPIKVDHLVADLKQRADGANADDLAEFELQRPRPEDAPGARVRFRPELGFSSKRVIGAPITFVKRVLLRLQFYVFDDLAKQADAAIARVDEQLAVEIAKRERLEAELTTTIRRLEERVRELEAASQRRAR